MRFRIIASFRVYFCGFPFVSKFHELGKILQWIETIQIEPNRNESPETAGNIHIPKHSHFLRLYMNKQTIKWIFNFQKQNHITGKMNAQMAINAQAHMWWLDHEQISIWNPNRNHINFCHRFFFASSSSSSFTKLRCSNKIRSKTNTICIIVVAKWSLQSWIHLFYRYQCLIFALP